MIFVTTAPATAATETIYDSMPSPLPSNYSSLSYQAKQTAEFGDHVTLAGTNRQLDSITVGMSSWACQTGGWSVVGEGSCSSTPGSTFNHPITLRIFNINPVDSTLPGTLITTVTQTVAVPYRPTTDAVNCASGTQWYNGTSCFNGFAFTVNFDFSASSIVLPNDITVTIAYNTVSWGASPMPEPGPYSTFSSLNLGLSGIAPTIGSEDITRAFWNTASASNYGDGGVTGTLREVHNSPQLVKSGAILMTIKAKVPAAPITPTAAPTSGNSLAETGVDSAGMASAAWIGGGVLTVGAILLGLVMYRRKRDAHH